VDFISNHDEEVVAFSDKQLKVEESNKKINRNTNRFILYVQIIRVIVLN